MKTLEDATCQMERINPNNPTMPKIQKLAILLNSLVGAVIC